MGVIYKFFCDNCKRSTPETTIPSYPEGWVRIFHTDHPEVYVCSYQCLLEQAQQFYDEHLPTMTLKYPIENPMPFGHHEHEPAPDTAAELFQGEVEPVLPPRRQVVLDPNGQMIDLTTGKELSESECHWHG